MNENRTSNRCAKPLLTAAALLAAVLTQTPSTARADATLAAVLGGTALAGLFLHASQPAGLPVVAAPHIYPPPVRFLSQPHVGYAHSNVIRTTTLVYPSPVTYYQPGLVGYYPSIPAPIYVPVRY